MQELAESVLQGEGFTRLTVWKTQVITPLSAIRFATPASKGLRAVPPFV